jgi:hypothetical protein
VGLRLERDGAPLVQELLAAGRSVLAIDPLLTGAYRSPYGQVGRPTSATHFAGYNRVDACWQAQDVLTGVAALQGLTGAAAVDVVAGGEAGLWAILAHGLAPHPIRRLAADAGGFTWEDEAAYLARLCVPHLLRLGGLTAALLLAAPAPLSLYGAADGPPAAVRDLYAALAQPEALVTTSSALPGSLTE